MNLEEKMSPINLKVISKGLDMDGFGIVKYYVRIESGSMIVLQAQAYYVADPPKHFHIIYPQGIHTSEVYTFTFIDPCHDDNTSYAEIALK